MYPIIYLLVIVIIYCVNLINGNIKLGAVYIKWHCRSTFLNYKNTHWSLQTFSITSPKTYFHKSTTIRPFTSPRSKRLNASGSSRNPINSIGISTCFLATNRIISSDVERDATFAARIWSDLLMDKVRGTKMSKNFKKYVL